MGQKHPSEMFCEKHCSEKLCNIHKKTPVLESRQASNFIKERLQHSYEIFKKNYFEEHLRTATSNKSINHKKNKKKKLGGISKYIK